MSILETYRDIDTYSEPSSVIDLNDAPGAIGRSGVRPDIAFFIRVLDGGGAQRDAILLANALSEANIKTAILTLQPRGGLRRLVSTGVHVEGVTAGRLATAAPALRRAILKLKPRSLFSSETAANLVAFLSVQGLHASIRPKLVLREVTAPSIAKHIDPYLQNRLAYHVIGQAYQRADRVVTLTQGARRDLIQNFGVPDDRITVMSSNAVIDRVAEARLKAAAEAPPAREEGLVVAVGRLSPEKDHATLIEAISELRGRKAARLVIVGEGPMRSRLEQQIARLDLGDRVRLAGATNDAFAWLLKAEVAVSSSKFEGLGNVLIEALACGTPVVSTDCPYGPREVLDHGRLGTLVPVGDAAALARGIERALDQMPDRSLLRQAAGRYTADRAATFLAQTLGLA